VRVYARATHKVMEIKCRPNLNRSTDNCSK